MRVVEAVGGWDRFKLYKKQSGKYLVRWTDPSRRAQGKSPQRSRELQAGTLEEAREQALDVVAELISPGELIEDRQDPTISEIWATYSAARAEETTPERQALLQSRWRNYYEDSLGPVRCSQAEREIKKFRDELVKVGRPWRDGSPSKIGSLSPNTMQEIVDTPRACVNLAIKRGLAVDTPEIEKIKVCGFQKPIDRTPKGRYLTMPEIGALIDAAGHEHVLRLILLEAGLAARVGSIAELEFSQIKEHAGIIDLLPEGEGQSTKGRPLVPLSGPLWRVVRESRDEVGRDERVIRYRGQGIKKRVLTQTMQRIRNRARIDGKQLEDVDRVRWYSFRHTLCDWLEERVPGKAQSMLLGHAYLDAKDRRRLLDERSPMTNIYRREKLGPLYQVAEAMDLEWWPEIQRHCRTDLRLGER